MNTSKKRTLGSSIFGMKCPRCREGNLFKTTTFSFSQPFEMLDECPVCGQNYMPEPGFYFGAMFISYIIWGWFSILLCLALIFLLGWTVNGAFALLIFLSVLFFVWIFRISRSIWIHINVKYQPQQNDSSKA
ncbi:MAG: DUF983 domain-containing protein [Bacteroidota bacterium]